MIKKSSKNPKKIAIIGSTGSIGLSTLSLVRTHPDQFKVAALAAKQNVELLFKQAVEFKPEVVCLYDSRDAAGLSKRLKPYGVRVVTGDAGLEAVASLRGAEQIIFALVGAVGLKPVMTAIRSGKQIGIANKEPLVMAGELILKEAKKFNAPIFPIDSEHSGLWQCLDGRASDSVKKLVLTSSGGPFRQRKSSFVQIKPEEALKHPKWKMGPKITIDSATLMNKGLEVIEAANLFSVSSDKVEVMIHPEALVHAMVEFVDGTHLAQLAVTDMRVPIQYAMTYPERLNNHLPTLDILSVGKLHFEKPDRKRFPCLELGYEASRAGGTLPAALNAANEVAVEAFLGRKIGFMKIPDLIEKVMTKHRIKKNPNLEAILDADQWAREAASALID